MKTDLQLQQDVIAELQWEPSVHAALIGVEVQRGVVTLTGQVNTFGEKWGAEQAAQRVAGVSALVVDLEVKLSGSNVRTDEDIALSAQNVIQWTNYLPKDAVKVRVEKGWLTLTGDVDWDYQRKSAVDAVRGLSGVIGVNNQLVIKPRISFSAVKADIEAAMQRRASEDAHAISVMVDGGDITLSGTVRSWSDREMARHSAWGTPGVHNVIDKMTIAI